MKKEKFMLYGISSLIVLSIIALLGICIHAFYNKANASNKSIQETTSTQALVPESYDNQTTALITDINNIDESISFYDIINDIELTLNYTGGTETLDKYGLIITLSKINTGDIVDVTYNTISNKILILKISDQAWEYQKINELSTNKSEKSMKLLGTKYKYTEKLIILSGDKQINLLELSNKDELTVKGYGQTIYSITVDKGHGYVKLINYDDYIGGTLEMGDDIIMTLTQDLLIVAREGNYKITIYNDDLKGSKNVNVIRDREITVDMGEFKRPPVKTGGVDFVINPIGSELYIDGNEFDYEDVIMLEYGNHNIVVKCSGYTTYSEEFTVDSAYVAINIQLKDPKEQNNSATESSTIPSEKTTNSTIAATEATTEPTTSPAEISLGRIDEEHLIYVQNPLGADIYFNGTNMGTSPINFTKQAGTHIVTLSKSGYVTKSYTIEVVDDGKDVFFSFPDMEVKQ